MTTVEPIRNKKDVEKVERYLQKQSARDHLIFVFGTNSGLRISDIVALNVGDVRNKNYVQIIEKKKGFPRDLLYDINKIPVTEDYTTIYTMLKEFNPDNRQPDLIVKSTNLFNLNITLSVEDGKLVLYDKAKRYDNFIEFVRCK